MHKCTKHTHTAIAFPQWCFPTYCRKASLHVNSTIDVAQCRDGENVSKVPWSQIMLTCIIAYTDHVCAANATPGNIPVLFLWLLCHPYIFAIFVENFYCSLIFIVIHIYICSIKGDLRGRLQMVIAYPHPWEWHPYWPLGFCSFTTAEFIIMWFCQSPLGYWASILHFGWNPGLPPGPITLIDCGLMRDLRVAGSGENWFTSKAICH